MVINKFGDRLYQGLQDTIKQHLQTIAVHVDAAQGEGFLRELRLRWGNHNKSMQMIRDILMVRPPSHASRRLGRSRDHSPAVIARLSISQQWGLQAHMGKYQLYGLT